MTRPQLVERLWHDLGHGLSYFGRPDVPSPDPQVFAGEGMPFENDSCPALQ